MMKAMQAVRLWLAGLLASAAMIMPADLAQAQARRWEVTQWTGTWGTAPAGPPAASQLQTLTNQTLRLIVHTSIGGTQVRIRISNEFGATPLRIGAAHIALRGAGADIVAGTDRVLTFSGAPSITLAPGAPALSDPVALDVPALSDLAVSLHLPGTTPVTTLHELAFQTNYVSTPGDFTASATLPVQRTIAFWPFLTEVDVQSPGGAVVAFGDSITDGVVTTPGANQRWPDYLAARLQGTREPVLRPRVGVINRAISGNRLLRQVPESTSGQAALARFDRDVLASAGVEHVIVLLGINDIGLPGAYTPASETVTAGDMIAGYRQLIARARIKGLSIYGGTLLPFEGTAGAYYTPAKEAVRQALNQWIRNSGEFDAVIDFDLAIRDPSRPSRMLPAFDSGDHLHPNARGMQALADAVPLDLFRRFGLAKTKVLILR